MADKTLAGWILLATLRRRSGSRQHGITARRYRWLNLFGPGSRSGQVPWRWTRLSTSTSPTRPPEAWVLPPRKAERLVVVISRPSHHSEPERQKPELRKPDGRGDAVGNTTLNDDPVLLLSAAPLSAPCSLSFPHTHSRALTLLPRALGGNHFASDSRISPDSVQPLNSSNSPLSVYLTLLLLQLSPSLDSSSPGAGVRTSIFFFFTFSSLTADGNTDPTWRLRGRPVASSTPEQY